MIKLTCLVAFAGFNAIPLVAQAQSYPVRSITVVVPFPAGGPSDVVARIVTERMGRTLGQQMVIENVGGAGGTLGSARVAAAQPDGYTLESKNFADVIGAPPSPDQSDARSWPKI
jgi:tripartite-type tricarboxylate transporter receptor subunit TctC